jgi:uncharacterized glyoxalase superfamily protein PhnB
MPIQSHRATPLFQVFDMRRSVAWYRDMLGFEVVQSHEPDGHLYWAMLRLGDATLMLNAQYEDEDRPAQEPPSLPGHHDVTLYFDCPDVDAAHKHLEAKDVKSSGPKVTYYKMKQLTVTDPDGYQLCFQQPA